MTAIMSPSVPFRNRLMKTAPAAIQPVVRPGIGNVAKKSAGRYPDIPFHKDHTDHHLPQHTQTPCINHDPKTIPGTDDADGYQYGQVKHLKQK